MSSMTQGTEGKATRREWIGLGVLMLPALIVSMDNTILFLATPFISAELNPSGSQLLWILDSYAFILGGLLITMGTLGDRIGRRRLLMTGGLAFAAASALGAFSTSAEMLIVARLLMGVAGATLAPSTLSLIRNMFHDPQERTTAIGAWTAAFGGGALVGPLLGGLLLERFWWGSVFLINVPVMLLLLVLAPLLLPEYRDPRPGRYDLLSAVLSLIAVLGVIYGIKRLGEDGFGVEAAVAIAAGAVAGIVFWVRQRRPQPLLDTSLFRERGFSVPLVANTISLFAMVGIGLFTAQYLQLVLGMQPFTAALWSIVSVVGMVVATSLAPQLVRAVPHGVVMAAGLAIAAAGFAVITQAQVDSGPALVVIGSAVTSLGLGMVITLASDLMVSAAPPERAGGASAISETGTELGGALGIAVLGTIGNAIYRSRLEAPPGVPEEAVDAASTTLGAAAETAAGLPAEAGGALLRAAREVFVDGMHVAAISVGGLVLVTALVTLSLLRRTKAGA
ncbi:MFS transporter [Planobispora rosea]|nr:MFS transporter [Planobispora rosea]